MMNRTTRVASGFVLTAALVACNGGPGGSSVQVERLPDVQPQLPQVPTLPPPPHPVTYPDGTYSVYGLRKRIRTTIDTEVEVSAYIVGMYQPPECPQGQECPLPVAPHMWIADTAGETDELKRLTVVGYAENHDMLNEAIAKAQRGQTPEVLEGMLPIPTDFAVGAKVKLKGRFAYISGSGFNIGDGLLEYGGHSILEAAPTAAPPPG